MLSHVLPVLRLAKKKRNALFLGQIVHFTHHEIRPKIFKCAYYISYDTKINANCGMRTYEYYPNFRHSN